MAIQAPFTSFAWEGSRHGWRCSWTFSARSIRWRIRIRPRRLCDGVRGLRHLAHILTPIETTTLIAGYGVLTQGYGVWKLRHALAWRKFAPFVIGGVIGVPIGTILLTH